MVTGEKCLLEYRVLPKDGSVRWLEVHGQCLYDEAGKPWRMSGIAVDITQRKRAELAMGRLAAIVESSDDAIISKDLAGIITSWNDGAERLFGYTAEEIIGKSITLLIPDDRQGEEPDILARLRNGERVEHFETIRRRKDGSLVDLSLTISPIRDEHGGIVGASKIARDITDRKAVESLRQTLVGELKHRLKNTLSTVLAIARQSFRGHVSWNSEAGRVSGTIVRVHTRNFEVNDYTRHVASP